MKLIPLIALALAGNLSVSYAGSTRQAPKKIASIRSGDLTMEFDSLLRSRIKKTGERDFSASEFVEVEKNGQRRNLSLFPSADFEAQVSPTRIRLTGKSGSLEKTIVAKTDPKFPGAILLKVSYKNLGDKSLKVLGWTNMRHSLQVTTGKAWGFLPSSSEERPNWLQPIEEGAKNDNFLGMNATDYGGGTPVVSIWSKQQGLAVGVVEDTPKQISLPLNYPKKQAPNLAVSRKGEFWILPGQSMNTYTSFAYSFHGDAFVPLRAFATYMKQKRPPAANPPIGKIGPIWCAWGYGRDFTVEQVLKTLPMVKKLGFEWVGLDDGWQDAIGDWTPNSKKFPGGEADFKRFIQEIHDQGFKVQLWWAPLAVHRDSRYAKEHPEQLLLNADGKPRDISWWDAWYLCPAQTAVQKNVADLTRKFLGDWKIDGLKLDGQHLNASPACFNKAHHHSHPEESAEMHSMVQKSIFETAQTVNRESLVEACPCGTSYSIYNLPYQNMTVASDPSGSVQVRQKGKMLRALTGEKAVFFGDHVELTREDLDFASTVGQGGLVGSNFTLAELNPPPPPPDDPVTILTPEKQAHWAKWLKIALANPLWKGKYLGSLYDVAFDLPETHAVLYGNSHYFGLYSENFKGNVELRGLVPGKTYVVTDYENSLPLGKVKGPIASLPLTFTHHLLLKATPDAETETTETDTSDGSAGALN